MQIVLDTNTVAAVLGALGGAVTTAGASYVVVVRPLRSMIGRLRFLLEDWYGEAARPGVPARKGVMERLASIDDQLKTNGGSTLRDSVSRIESSVTAHLASHATGPAGYPPAA